MSLPYISVVVPALNAESTIGATILSLKQVSYPINRFEIIVVDGGSTDRTQEIVKSFQGVRLIRQVSTKKGVAGARNQGALAAKGDILAFTDADCVVTKDWLTKIAKFYMKNKDAIGIGGVLLPLNNAHASFIAEFMHPKHSIPLSEGANCSFRKNFFFQIGGFNENIGFGAEDTELAKRILSGGYKTLHSTDLVVYHLVNDNLFQFLRRYFRYSYGNLRYRFYMGKFRPSFGFLAVPFQAFRKSIRVLVNGEGFWKAIAFLVLTCLSGYSELLGEWWHYSQLGEVQPLDTVP